MADNVIERNGQLPIPGALNSPSPRFFSFTIPIEGERFTNPFFRLLDSSGRNAEML